MNISIIRHAKTYIFRLKSLLISTLLILHPIWPTAIASVPSHSVAITQITSHESLDKVYAGIIDSLEKGGISRQSITFANAQGDIATAVQIANKFASQQPDIVIPIATPSAQTCMKALKAKNIPIVFASVTDPVAAKLVSSLSQPGGSVTGTRNHSPIKSQLELLKSVIPEIKTLGLIINYSEENSVSLMKVVQSVAPQLGIKVLVASSDTSAMVSTAARSIINKVDAFFLLQDNTVASSLTSLLSVANSNQTPVMSTYLQAVERGALIGLAYDEFAIGQQTGEIAIRILNGEDPKHIPVQDPELLELALNLKAAEKLKIQLSKNLIEKADKIYP